MNLPLQAEDCYLTVIGHKGSLKRDTYLVPYAMYERALILKDKDIAEAMDLLEKAKYLIHLQLIYSPICLYGNTGNGVLCPGIQN